MDIRLSKKGQVTNREPVFRELTAEEIDAVAGGNPAGAAVGAAVGGLGYLGGAAVGGDFSWGGFGTAIGVGALGGATMGATAFGAYAAPRIAFIGGGAVQAVEQS